MYGNIIIHNNLSCGRVNLMPETSHNYLTICQKYHITQLDSRQSTLGVTYRRPQLSPWCPNLSHILDFEHSPLDLLHNMFQLSLEIPHHNTWYNSPHIYKKLSTQFIYNAYINISISKHVLSKYSLIVPKHINTYPKIMHISKYGLSNKIKIHVKFKI